MSVEESCYELIGQVSLEKSTKFSYDAFDNEICLSVRQLTSEIKNLIHCSAQDIVDIGQKLIKVKDKLGHGKFALWLKAEFDWSESTARKFMQVARQFKSANFADLKIATSALYLLACNNNPPAARQEALQRAKKGESIDYSRAKSIVAQYKKIDTSDLSNQVTVDVSVVLNK